MRGIEAGWTLHPLLRRDCADIVDLPLCRLLLMNDANYPWLILVPRRPNLVEIIDLDEGGRMQLMRETSIISVAVKAITHCDKLNVAALGNAVPQLHVHVIARFRNDPAWPTPVWGAVAARIYAEDELSAMTDRVRAALAPEIERRL